MKQKGTHRHRDTDTNTRKKRTNSNKQRQVQGKPNKQSKKKKRKKEGTVEASVPSSDGQSKHTHNNIHRLVIPANGAASCTSKPAHGHTHAQRNKGNRNVNL